MASLTVLIIDYDPRSVEAIRIPLEKAGHCVEVATNGPKGLELFLQLRPDLTLVEFMIPKKSGPEVCKELRTTPEGESAALVMMTSRFRGRQARADAKHEYRVDDFLEKPISEDRLFSLLERFGASSSTDLESAPAEAMTSQPLLQQEASPETPPTAIEPGEFEAEVTDRLDSVLGNL